MIALPHGTGLNLKPITCNKWDIDYFGTSSYVGITLDPANNYLNGGIITTYMGSNKLTIYVPLFSGSANSITTIGFGSQSAFKKIYFEVKFNGLSAGIYAGVERFPNNTNPPGFSSTSWSRSWGNLDKYSNSTPVSVSGNIPSNGSIIMVALDVASASVWFGVDGVWDDHANPSLGATPSYSNLGVVSNIYPCIGGGSTSGSTGVTMSLNLGESTFTYTIPNGFVPASSNTAIALYPRTPNTGFTGLALNGISSGKAYWEYTFMSGQFPYVGVSTRGTTTSTYPGNSTQSWGYGYNATKVHSSLPISYGKTWSAGDVIGVALDMDNGSIYFAKNGVYLNNGFPTSGTYSLGAAYTGLTGTIYPAFGSADSGTSNVIVSANFGCSSFIYSAPLGYKYGIFPNYSTFDPNNTFIDTSITPNSILTNQNLAYQIGKSIAYSISNVGKNTGKWYWEINPIVGTTSYSIGVSGKTHSGQPGTDNNSWTYVSYVFSGYWSLKFNNNVFTSYGATYGLGDYIGVALDMDLGNLTMYKNGVSQGIMYSGLTGTKYPIVGGYYPTGYPSTLNANFGASLFKYTPPVGYNYGIYI